MFSMTYDVGTGLAMSYGMDANRTAPEKLQRGTSVSGWIVLPPLSVRFLESVIHDETYGGQHDA
jgi:hypothetical protein